MDGVSGKAAQVGDTALSGRTALVTGAGSGIGAAISEAFARAGACVVLADLPSSEGLSAEVERCRDMGARALALAADVSDPSQVEGLFDRAEREISGVDILVNNAGILTFSDVISMEDEIFDRMIAVNLKSVFMCSRRALPGMVERRFGRIINISSQLGQKGGPKQAHYSAAKAGVIGFTKALAREVATLGVNVNCIAPGPISTPLTAGIADDWSQDMLASLPLGRVGQPWEVAPTAVLLASEPGGNLYVGQTLGPNSGDVML